MPASSPASRTVLVIDQGTLAPVVASSAPMPYQPTPFRFWNLPAATTLPVPAGAASASTSASAVGAQGSTAPVDACTAASRVRARPFIEVKMPPRYRVSPDTASAFTRDAELGFQPLTTAPVVASSATTRLRAVPLTSVKEPPTKIVLPSADALIARPWAFSVGAQVVFRAPVVMS